MVVVAIEKGSQFERYYYQYSGMCWILQHLVDCIDVKNILMIVVGGDGDGGCLLH